MKSALKRAPLFVFLAAGLLLGACSTPSWLKSDDEEKLPGERVSVLELQRNIEPDSDALTAQGFIAPSAWRNDFWPQAGGYPNHAMQNLVLNEGPLKKTWSVDIGEGATKVLPLTAQPIVVDGRVFTLDTDSQVSAFSTTDGKKLWSADISDPQEDEKVIGGGLAYSHGQLYVTGGYDEVIALSPSNGSILWRAPIPAPSRAAPTAMEDRIFVSTLDNRIIAINPAQGQILWEYAGIGNNTGLIGGASPAVAQDVVVPAFSSGELFALRVENGTPAWGENLSGAALGGGGSALSDIRGLPVIDKDIVIALSFSGRMAAIDLRTGTRIWQREIGGSETPWVAGNHLFVISSENALVALGRDTGSIRWVDKLPRYEDPEDRDNPIFWTGPVLAGGRLIVASSTGEIREIAPEDGKIIRSWSVKGSVTTPPVIAGGVLYLLTDDGELVAYQ